MTTAPAHHYVMLTDILKAEKTIAKYIVVTPLVTSPALNKLAGMNLYFKLETFQTTGSFKLRGAANQIAQLSPSQKKRGVFAVSSGNWAQAIAYRAREAGIKAKILMPHDAPSPKIKKTKKFGAAVEFYRRGKEDREARGRAIAQRDNLIMLHPFNDRRTIAGQGTIGLEIRRQAAAMNFTPDSIVVPTSGGGLISGITVAVKSGGGKTPQIFSAEPQGFDDMKRSLRTGKIVKNKKQSGTICDALTAPQPGENPLDILKLYGAKGLTASDEDALAGMSVLANHFKVIAEPGGAIGLGAVLRHRRQFKGQNVVVVVSGGNVDLKAYQAMLKTGRAHLKTLFPALAAA